MKHSNCAVVVLLSLLLSACGDQSYEDLIIFMAEKKARPAGNIEPIPTFMPYRPFDYGATMLRAPFDRPVAAKELVELLPQSSVEPDSNRPREFLEQFNIESLRMVGTIEQNGQLWALIDDGQGNVHYVKQGNYIGKNHGKIIAATSNFIQITEIVPAGGAGGWVERPRTLELRE
ncbi:MAG TPA: pilus assembly protein PilP [Pseudomonadales bacterium]